MYNSPKVRGSHQIEGDREATLRIFCVGGRATLELHGASQMANVNLNLPEELQQFVNGQVEAGEFEVMVGASSRDQDLLKSRFSVS